MAMYKNKVEYYISVLGMGCFWAVEHEVVILDQKFTIIRKLLCSFYQLKLTEFFNVIS